MPQLIEAEGKLVGIVTEPSGYYVADLMEADRIRDEYKDLTKAGGPLDGIITDAGYYVADLIEAGYEDENLTIASLPDFTQATDSHPEIWREARKGDLNTTTIVSRGVRTITGPSGSTIQVASTEILHRLLMIPTWGMLDRSMIYIPSVFENRGIKNPSNHEISCVDSITWDGLGKGKFSDGSRQIDIPEVSLDDLKKGVVPPKGTPYRVVAYDTDNPNLFSEGRLDRYGAEQSDYLAMLLSGYENLEQFIKMMFYPKKDGGEGLTSIDNRCQVAEVGRDLQTLMQVNYPIMQAVTLGNGEEGLRSGFDSGRLLLLPDESEGQHQEMYLFDEVKSYDYRSDQIYRAELPGNFILNKDLIDYLACKDPSGFANSLDMPIDEFNRMLYGSHNHESEGKLLELIVNQTNNIVSTRSIENGRKKEFLMRNINAEQVIDYVLETATDQQIKYLRENYK